MRFRRLAPIVAATALLAACESTQDSPGKGDTAVPYGGAANGQSVGQTPGYLNAAGSDRNPNPNAASAAPAPQGADAARPETTPAGQPVDTAAAARPAAPAH